MIRKKDFPMIILIVSFSLIASFILGNTENRSKEVSVIRPITANFQEPDPTIFNDEAINPTELIRIGDEQKEKPFQSEE
jgi:hypothetical protein